MSISPKDLQDMFGDVMNAFQPGDVSKAAQVVGGKVIENQPPETKNARLMTQILGGGKPGSKGTAAPTAPPGFSIPTTTANASGESPTGSKSKPFVVEFTQEAANNLARKIVEQGKGSGKPDSALQRFMQGFGAGHTYSPAAAAVRKIKGMFGGNEKESEAPEPMPNAVLELAKRNASRLSRFGSGAKFNQDPFGTLAGEPGTTGQANLGRKLAERDLFSASGQGSKKGYSQLIKSAPAAAGSAGAEAAAAGGMGSLAGAAAGMAGKVFGLATGVVEAIGVVYGVTTALKAFGEATVEGNRHLAKWSGSLAVQMAKMDIDAIKREQSMAMATEGSATMAASEYGKLSQEFQPIAESMATIGNLVGTTVIEAARALNGILTLVNTIFGPLLMGIEKYLGSGKGNNELPMESLFNFIKTMNAANTVASVREARERGARVKKPDEAAPAPIPGVVDPKNAWRRRI